MNEQEKEVTGNILDAINDAFADEACVCALETLIDSYLTFMHQRIETESAVHSNTFK